MRVQTRVCVRLCAGTWTRRLSKLTAYFTILLCRILDDIGGAFGMGAVGGGLWHLFKGMKNSPRGQRFRGGLDVSSFKRVARVVGLCFIK